MKELKCETFYYTDDGGIFKKVKNVGYPEDALCKFVNEKEVEVVSISEDDMYVRLWYREKN